MVVAALYFGASSFSQDQVSGMMDGGTFRAILPEISPCVALISRFVSIGRYSVTRLASMFLPPASDVVQVGPSRVVAWKQFDWQQAASVDQPVECVAGRGVGRDDELQIKDSTVKPFHQLWRKNMYSV